MPSSKASNTPSYVDRRGFLRVAGLGGAALLARGTGALAADYDPAASSLMEFDVSYRTQIKNLPRDAEDVHIWMPLPPSDAAQQITDLEVESPLPYELTHDPIHGNEMLYASTKKRMEPFGVEVRYHVTRHRAGTQKVELSDAELQKHLRLTKKVRVTDDVEAFASKVIGTATDPYDIAKRVFDGIREVLFYDKSLPGCGTGDTAWIMKHRRGKCDDYHALFMAILISRGVPIRWEQGFPLPFPTDGKVESGQLEGDCTGSHCWVSFYAPSDGWVPVDVSEADKTDVNSEFFFGHLSPNRFQVSAGRSVVLNPAQGGDPLPSFAFAYAEADGIPLIYLANYENIIKYDVTRVEMA
jgi:transglutaminase-like putative cysteine protease